MKKIFLLGVMILAALTFAFAEDDGGNQTGEDITVDSLCVIFTGLSDKDVVGMWGVFGPGGPNTPMSGNTENKDLLFRAKLKLASSKTLKCVVIKANEWEQNVWGREGWSTTADQSWFGKDPYPMVVFYQGQQLNTGYDVPLGTYNKGEYDFELYCQPEYLRWGGKLWFVFTDGTQLVADSKDACAEVPVIPPVIIDPIEENITFNDTTPANPWTIAPGHETVPPVEGDGE